MTKVTLNDFASLANQAAFISQINANNATIETAFDNTLSRNGTTPNQMGADLDMNSNRILNLVAPLSLEEPVRLGDISSGADGLAVATQAEAEAATSNSVLMTPLRTKNYAQSNPILISSPLSTTVFTPAGFGGTFKTAHNIDSTGTNTHLTSAETTLSVHRTATGSGANGQAAADSAAYIHAEQSDYLNNTTLGEIDVLNINLRKGVNGDGGSILVNSKRVDSASYGLTCFESRAAIVQAATGTELRSMKTVAGRFAGGLDTNLAGIGFYTRPDSSSSNLFSAFAACQDLTNSSFFDYILYASYQNNPANRFFAISTGSDHKTATTIYGTTADSVSVRYLPASTAMQWLATDGSTVLASLANTTGNFTLKGTATVNGSAGSTSGDAPAVTIAPTLTNSLVGGLNITLSEAATATAAYKPIFNHWTINDGSTAAASSDFIKGFQIQHKINTVGAVDPGTGNRTAINCILELDGLGAGTVGTQLVGGYFHSWANVSAGGTLGGERGSVFGFAAEGVLFPSATNMFAVHGAELDVMAQTGSSTLVKTVCNFVNIDGDAVQGSVIDAMGWFYSGSTATARWDYGILFGDNTTTLATAAQFPIKSTGTIIATGYGATGSVQSTAANGIDFTKTTFSGSAFKSTGFSVSGTGAVSGTTITGTTSLIAVSASNGITLTTGSITRNNAAGGLIIETGTNAGNSMVFKTANAVRLTIADASVTTSVTLGYGTGAGGTVTQATSKSTAVTINKPSGQITMNSAALANAANVSFTVNNSTVSATDTISINVASGASDQAYQIMITAVAAGSFKVWVRNISGVSLSEAIVLNFNVIKGSST